ncbi:hypothetical protein [Streptomyces sp. ADI95-16]|uniref:hypothetical protein n=1 Tax=Streptomyces sp. ADI95-16 TaxID=1522758 RepID=UPI00349F4EA5
MTRTAGTHLAAVTDAQGTVIGFLTMEDLLEELVGAAHDPGGIASARERSSHTTDPD